MVFMVLMLLMLFSELLLVTRAKRLSVCVHYVPLLPLKWLATFLAPALPVLTLTSLVLRETHLCGTRTTDSSRLVCAQICSSSSHVRHWVTHQGKNTITMQPFFPNPPLSLDTTGAYFSHSRDKVIYFDLCFPICSLLATRSWSLSRHIIPAYLWSPTRRWPISEVILRSNVTLWFVGKKTLNHKKN